MEYKVSIQQRDVCYQGFYKLENITLQHSLYQGGMSSPIKREVIFRARAVAVLLYDPVMDAVVLIEQFRVGALQRQKPWVLELVAGYQEEGETIEDVVKREVMEEAGLEVSHIQTLARFYLNPANTSEEIILTCARVDASIAGGVHGVKEEGEDIRVEVIGYDDLVKLLEQGAVDSATPIIAVQWLIMNREHLRQRWGA